ncbi:hypothetical protein B484DRAFT_473136, partial [Ochromonadaceae sp. CCMP2298]
MHVTINGIVYETENMGALATLLRPYITRPTPAIPAPVIQIHAPDTQINTTQAAYTDEEAQPRNPLAAATILQRAYDAKYSDTENTRAPTYADKLLATQSEMYRDARRTSCINVEEGWTEVTGKKAISKKKPTYKELFDTSSEDEPNTKLPAANKHSLYRKEEEVGFKYGIDAGSMDAGTSCFQDGKMDKRVYTYTEPPKAPTPEPQSPVQLQKQEEEDLAYAQALQCEENGEEELDEVEGEELLQEEYPPQDKTGPRCRDPKNFTRFMKLVRPAKYNKNSRAGGDGIGTPGTDPDHDVRRHFSSADITKYRKKLIKARDKKGIRELNKLVGWRCVPGEPVIYTGPTPEPQNISHAFRYAPTTTGPSYLSMTPVQREQHSSQQTAPPVTAPKPRPHTRTAPPESRLLTQKTADRLLTQQTAEAKDSEPSDDSEDSSDSSTSVSSAAGPSPIISQRDVYVNLLRLEKAKADDFRQHPDRATRVEVGSAQDRILGAKPPRRITHLTMEEWQEAYDWAQNKSIVDGLHDVSSIPDEWAYIPRTYQKQFFNRFNKNSAAGHYLTGIWLTYHNGCPLALSTKSRIPTPMSDITRSSGLMPMAYRQIAASAEER